MAKKIGTFEVVSSTSVEVPNGIRNGIKRLRKELRVEAICTVCGKLRKTTLRDLQRYSSCSHEAPSFLHKKHRREYSSWSAMKNRCTNTSCQFYPRYGGRGISFTSRWDSFSNFLEDMGPRPEGTSIDRIDNDGNYEPNNCRWATAKQQRANRSDCA